MAFNKIYESIHPKQSDETENIISKQDAIVALTKITGAQSEAIAPKLYLAALVTESYRRTS